MTLVELRQTRGTLVEQMRAIVTRSDGRAMTAEETQEWERLDQEQERLGADVARRERQDSLDAALRVPQPTLAGGRQEDPVVPESRRVAVASPEYARAFAAYLRLGLMDLSGEQRSVLRQGFRHEERALGVAPDAAGGYTVPEAFSNRLEEEIKALGGMREAATIFSTDSGADMPYPTVDDTANEGEILAEHAPVQEQDVTFASITFRAWKYSSKLVRVSYELMQDSYFDLEAWLASALAQRIFRITNRHFTTGTGTGQPQGIVTGATAGPTGPGGSATTISYADLVALEHSVDPAYRASPKAGFMMHDSALRAMKLLVDTQGRPLWTPGLLVKEPDRILGYRYYINQHMPAMGAGSKSVIFGDLGKYMIREVKGVTLVRLNERFAEFHQVGFMSWARYDGRLLDAGTHPVVYYTNGGVAAREGGPEPPEPSPRMDPRAPRTVGPIIEASPETSRKTPVGMIAEHPEPEPEPGDEDYEGTKKGKDKDRYPDKDKDKDKYPEKDKDKYPDKDKDKYPTTPPVRK